MRRLPLLAHFLFSVFLTATLSAQTTAKRKLMPSDIYRLQTIGDPQVAPDGQWVAYTLTSVDSALNKRNTDIWMVSWDGTQDIQMTSSPEGESQPKWSPDGKYLSFVAARDGDKYSQIWLLNRKGGEGIQLTKLKDNLVDYDWSPDGKKILLTLKTPKDTSKPKTPKPIVINRYQFKRDVEGYITEKPSIHLYVLDVASKKLDTLTTGDYQETGAVWSPDGKQVAFVSNHTEDPDRNINSDIFIMEAKPGAVQQKITSWNGSDISPEWSPNGKQLAYLRTALDAYSAYEEYYLVLQDITPGSTPKLLSKSLDRPVSNLKFSKDGSSIGVLVSDDRERYVAAYNTQTGVLSKIIGGQKSFNTLQPQFADNWLVGMSEPQLPSELYAVEKGKLRRLTKHQDAFVAPLELASVEGFQSTAVDGNQVSSLLFRPAGIPATQKLPAIFYIHGGPTAQDEYGFDLTRQMLAAAGYAVVGVNYRGSSGRGLNYSTTISGDWGNKEVKDITSAVDYVIAKGIADPDKLGICGWSYGGIMTDYMIASDTRFKAASSGAGVAMVSSLYGVDQYIMQYDHELGVPWKNIDKYLSMSYPFLKADKIKTPTQFMVGQNDFNVPSPGSEQMYQALRSLGIPTELIVYPGQFHGISVPGYIKDRFDRYLAWFGKYLK